MAVANWQHVDKHHRSYVSDLYYSSINGDNSIQEKCSIRQLWYGEQCFSYHNSNSIACGRRNSRNNDLLRNDSDVD